jgi:hypothetical protein
LFVLELSNSELPKLLNKSILLGIFRYGARVPVPLLIYFDGFSGDYEVKFHLSRLREQVANNLTLKKSYTGT